MQTDAKKNTVTGAEALKLARAASEIIAAKGAKVVRVKLADKPTDDQLAALIIGPSGNLRAPTLRIGKKLLIGFEPEMYRDALT